MEKSSKHLQCLLLLLIGLMTTGPTWAQDAVIDISTPEQLVAAAQKSFSEGTYRLTADIDMTGQSYTPPNWQDTGKTINFVFDGNNHKISNLHAVGESYSGLFGAISSSPGTIKNLEIENSTFTVTKTTNFSACGVFFGYTGNASSYTVTNCKSTNNVVNTAQYVGGIVGYSSNPINISHCTITGGTINGQYLEGTNYKGRYGGVLGYAQAGNGSISDISIDGTTMNFNSDRAGLVLGTNNTKNETGNGHNFIGDNITISNVTWINTANGAKYTATPVLVGANSDGRTEATTLRKSEAAQVKELIDNGKVKTAPAQAKIGNVYYATLGDAITDADENETVTVISAGTYTYNADDLPAGAQVAVDESVKDQVTLTKTEKAVAQIGDTQYASLQDALTAVDNGQTITLLSDVANQNDVLTINKSLTLDLNGKTISGEGGLSGSIKVMLLVSKDAKDVTIKSSKEGGAINVATSYDKELDAIYQVGDSLTLESGTITVENTGKGSAAVADAIVGKSILVKDGVTLTATSINSAYGLLGRGADWDKSKLYIDGGTITANATAGTANGISANGKLIITGGKINAITKNGAYGINLGEYGEADIKGGEIYAEATANSFGLRETASKNTDGTIKAASTANIEGGTITSKATKDTGSGVTYGVYAYGTTNISGGTITSEAKAEVSNAVVVNAGTTTISKDAVILAKANKQAYATTASATGTLNIEGGTVTANATTQYAYAFNANDNANINVTGGKFNVSAPTSVYLVRTGNVKISGGYYNAPSNIAGYLTDGAKLFELAESDYKYEVAHAVAQIGTTYYKSLQDAFNAVEAKGTTTTVITLTADASGDGVILYEKDAKNITLNLNGHTYTVSGALVGSKGTENQAFHFEKGNTVTIENGALMVTNPKAHFVIQNYSELTLDNVQLDASDNSNILYVVSNNFGSMTTTGNTVIKAPEGKMAFDVWYGQHTNYYDGVKVNIGDETTLSGIIEYGAKKDVTSDNWNEKAQIVFGDKVNLSNIKVRQSGDKAVQPNVVRASATTKPLYDTSVNGQYYPSLQAAVNAATAGQTVTLLADETAQNYINIKNAKDITLDLNNKTFEVNATNCGLLIQQGSKVVVKNGTINVTRTGNKNTGISIMNHNNNVTIENVIINAKTLGSRAIEISTSNNNTLTVNSGTFTAGTFGVAYKGHKNTITINGGTFNANRGISGNGSKATEKLRYDENTVTVNGGVFNVTYDAQNGDAQGMYFPNNDNVTIKKAEINVTNGQGIVVRGGEVTLGEGVAITVSGDMKGSAGDDKTVLECAAVIFDTHADYPGLQENPNSHVAIEGGTYKTSDGVNNLQLLTSEKYTGKYINVSGGTFSTPIDMAYCADGFMPAKTEEGYGVVVLDDRHAISYTESENGETKYFDGNRIVIEDTGYKYYSFHVARDVDNVALNYNRTFYNDTYNCWYVPFDMEVVGSRQWTFYQIYMSSLDEETNTWTLQAKRILSGTLLANTPYLVKADNSYATVHGYSINRTTLYSPDSKVRPAKTIHVETSTQSFDFIGTYTKKMPTADDYDWYVLTNKAQFSKRTPTSGGLNPFRWYLKITDKDGYGSAKPFNIKVNVIDDAITDIKDLSIDNADQHKIYDLQGREVSNPGKGIYIVNGKKVIFK